ncbi:MAG TPA: cytochrome d ubiquinol oxidase subunit II [Thermoplasmata archaeon]|jgi:cytochrome d ubiquinol oxidase subunit II
MDLPAIWFLLVGFLFAAYTVLDGFDLGIGVLFPVLGRTPVERRTLLRMLAPVWDGNEVWLLAGAMALFGAFPDVYATVFSGFYLALILVLVGLILRAVSFEFWSLESRRRKFWDVAFVLGSLLPALLLPVALGNVIVGVPLDADHEFAGDFFTLLRPFPLALGLFGLLVILLQGAGYAAMKTVGAMQKRAHRLRRILSLAFLPLLIAVAILTAIEVPAIAEKPIAWTAIAIVLALWGASFLTARRKDDNAAFFLSSLLVLGLWGVVGAYQFPSLVTASNDPSLSLTAYNASSGESTLGTMLAVALIGLPAVVLYTVYAYRVFKGRLPVAA